MTIPMNGVFSLRGRIVVVTGGLGLLGLSLTRALSKSGARVIVVDINDEIWKKVSKEFNEKDCNVFYENCDVAEIENVKTNIEKLEQKYGNVDIWINNAYPRTKDWANEMENITNESWRKNVDMQLNSYCICSNEIAKRMAMRKKGSLINIASIYGIIAPDFSVYEGTDMTSPAVYTAVKGGIIAYSRYLASYFRNKGVRINVVCPGGIYNNQPEEFVKKYSRKTLLGKMAEPDEIAWPVVFLASDAASYITGATLVVDGGWTAV